MTHEIVKIPGRTGTAAAQDVRKLLQHRGRIAGALALATLVALLGVLARSRGTGCCDLTIRIAVTQLSSSYGA